MTQKKAILCVGIDSFETGIKPLVGAANDAHKLGSVFELLLGFQVKVLTHEDLRGNNTVLGTAEYMLRDMGEGDVFGLFLATHGKTLPDRKDHVYFLPHVRRSSLDRGGYGDGLLSLLQLAEETARRGVSRFFIFDACRSPIDVDLNDSRDGDDAYAYEGEEIHRNMLMSRKLRIGTEQSPLVIVNSCADRQRASELPIQRRGLFSLSAEDVLTDYVRAGRPVAIDDTLVANIASQMQRRARANGLRAEGQSPTVQGPSLPIWARDDAQATLRLRLLEEFESQLATGELEEPYGRSARDTLPRLQAAGLPGAEHDALLLRLRQAVADKKAHADEAFDKSQIDKALADPNEFNWNQVRWSARLPETRKRADEEMVRLRAAAASLAAEGVAAMQRLAAEQAATRRAEEVAAIRKAAEAQAAQAAELARQDRERKAKEDQALERARRMQQLNEEADWRLAQQADTEAALQNYCVKWPQGEHVGQARHQLQALKDRAAARASEERAWRAMASLAPHGKAELTQALQRCVAYLRDHPDGARRDQVRARQAAWQTALSQPDPGATTRTSAMGRWVSAGFVVSAAAAWWATTDTATAPQPAPTTAPPVAIAQPPPVARPPAAIPPPGPEPRPTVPDTAALAAGYLPLHRALQQNRWWANAGIGPDTAVPTEVNAAIVAAARLAPNGVPDAWLDAGRAHALGRGLPLNQPLAVQYLAQWLAGPGQQADTQSDDHKRAIEALDDALASAVRTGKAGSAWAGTLRAVESIARNAPVDYWRGFIQRCLVNPPDLSASEAAFKRAAVAPSRHAGADLHRALAAEHLKLLRKPCGTA